MSLRGSSIQSGNGTTCTVSWPSGTAAGDLAIVFFGDVWASATGWTEISRGSSSSLAFMNILKRTLNSSDIAAGSQVFTISGSPTNYIAAIAVVAGGGTVNVEDVSITWYTTSPISTAPVTPTFFDTAIFFGFSQQNTTVTLNKGAGAQSTSTATGSGVITSAPVLTPGSITVSAIASPALGGNGVAVVTLSPSGSSTDPYWLIIDDPSVGFTNHTPHLSDGTASSFTLTRGQRGTATIDIGIHVGDTYTPTLGSQDFLYEQTAAGYTRVFAGTIDTLSEKWLNDDGERSITLSCVTFEQCFDTLLIKPKVYAAGTPSGTVFADILNDDCAGVPVTAGTISAGVDLPDNLVIVNQRPSEIFAYLVGLNAGFIWYVNNADATINFHASTAVAAPLTLAASDILWGTIDYEQTRADFRDRQLVQASKTAFPHSAELFQGTGADLFFTLRNYPEEITNAWVTHNTQNTATATFTGVPSDGDTITVGYPSSGSIYDWAAAAPYSTGQIVIDAAGHVQRATTGGTSGASLPAWTEVLGATIIDGTVTWTDEGPSGGGSFSATVYTWKTALDNEQSHQVLIGSTAGECAQNLADAINAKETTKALKYSLPTWENPLVNADALIGSTFVIRNKNAGQGYIAALSESCANFTWSAALTSGGSTTFNTYVLELAEEGTSLTANLYWTKGSKQVKLASTPKGGPNAPISSAWYLQVEYRRIGGDTVAVEDTALVATRAALEGGTGKYQQLTSDASLSSPVLALAEAQAGLALYKTLPVSFKFQTDHFGLIPGQQCTVSVTGAPVGAPAVLDGDWVVQEVQGDYIPGAQFLRADGGHFRYTITLINAVVIGADIELWQKMAGRSSSGGSGAGASAPATALAGIDGGVPTTRTISTTAPLTGGGDLSADRTLAISDFTGDSGSGGAKGTVPAPGAGDAALGKFLSAGGGWDVPGGGSSFVANDTPSGTINGSNVTFTLASTPNPSGSLILFLNGVQQLQGTDYTLSGSTITYATAPASPDWHRAFYETDGGSTPNPVYACVTFAVDGGASVPSAGTKRYAQVPFAGTIVGWSVVADQSGSLTIEVDKHSSSAPPSAPTKPNTTTDKISASAPISLSGAASASSGASGVSTWTTSVAQWDVIGFNLTAASTLLNFVATIFIRKS